MLNLTEFNSLEQRRVNHVELWILMEAWKGADEQRRGAGSRAYRH